MMKQISLIILFGILIQLMPLTVDGQVWPFKKRGQAQKASQDLKVRQKKEGQGNAFNELQPMGSSLSRDRVDYLWSSETAYTSRKRTGNVSLTTPSRLGISHGLELSTILPANYWVPNLMVKKTHFNKKLLVSSRHGVYSATPGLLWAQKRGYQTIADSMVKVPGIISLRNELIISKPFGGDEICDSGRPYLIITAGASADVGIPFEKNYLSHIDEHVLGSRSPALAGKGWLFSGRLRVDAELTNSIFIEAGIKGFFGNFYGGKSLEQHAGLQSFISNNFSFTLGYILSVGNFSSSNIKIYPSIDLSWYFGSKPGPSKGLFDRKMR
jgi:hypothetical protein